MDTRMILPILLLAGAVSAACNDLPSAPELAARPEATVVAASARALPQAVQSAFFDNSIHGEITDATGSLVTPGTNPAIPVYAKEWLGGSGMLPIVTPVGTNVTLGEWLEAEGVGKVTCVNKGTLYNLHFSGLIPKGVYTVWNFTATGAGALGAADAIQNAFTASASGEGQISVLVPAGAPMSFGGVMPACSLDGGIFMVLNYHIDQMTFVGNPGPDLNDAAQLYFDFNFPE